MIRINPNIDKTARAIVEFGLGSLSDSEELSLHNFPEFKEAVMHRVNELRKEKEIAEERSLQIKVDEEILSKKRPSLSISNAKDAQTDSGEAGLETEAILVVDDIEDDLKTITAFLSEGGYLIYSATNMQDALDILDKYQIHMLVTDIVLPMYRLTKEEYKEWIQESTTRHSLLAHGITTENVEVTKTRIVKEETKDYSNFGGFKLLDEARKIMPWLPVIIVSRYADLEMARRAIGSQVQDILSKQLHLEDSSILLACVKNHKLPLHRRLASLGSERLLEFISGASEKTVTLKVLVPLLHKLGFKGIQYTHGSNECGLDLIFYDIDRFGVRRYIGAQVKAEKIHMNVGDSKNLSIVTILQQIHQAFESTLYIPSEKKELELDRLLIISSKSITQPAREYIKKALIGKVYTQHIDFWDATTIIDYILKS